MIYGCYDSIDTCVCLCVSLMQPVLTSEKFRCYGNQMNNRNKQKERKKERSMFGPTVDAFL